MKYFWQLFWMLIPREGEGDGDGGDGDSGDGDAGDSGGGGDGDGATGDGKPQGGNDPEGKPDWLADKFWNPDLKAPRTEVLGKAYNELEGKLRGKTDEIKEEIRAEMVASAPESYEIKLSDDLKIPDNVELDLTAEDPMVEWFFGFAKKNGLSQDIVTEAINEYVGIELKAMPDVQAEIEKLGDHGQDRLLRVHNWMESKLSDDQFKSINPLLSSAAQVEALEVLMKSSGPSDFEGDGKGEALTLDELRTMQNDVRYYRDKDPTFIKKVEEGYKRLYGGK
jgi:hypothetical protein